MKKSHHQSVLIFLSISGILVWGVIIKQLLWGAEYEPFPIGNRINSVSGIHPSKKGVVDSSRINNSTNPFLYQIPRKPSPRPVEQRKSDSQPVLPTIVYAGMVKNGADILAILEKEDGESHICKRGDTLGDIVIADIAIDWVELNWGLQSWQVARLREEDK